REHEALRAAAVGYAARVVDDRVPHRLHARRAVVRLAWRHAGPAADARARRRDLERRDGAGGLRTRLRLALRRPGCRRRWGGGVPDELARPPGPLPPAP